MESFPFSQTEWQRVLDISLSIVNATLINDAVLMASLFEDLLIVLDDLRNRHGDHPILLETEADFCDDPSKQLDLYRSAIQLAQKYDLPTFTIRISLAGVLLQFFHDPLQAINELEACKMEMTKTADESETKEWHDLMAQCKKRLK
jgi:hypothetical protein